MKLKATVVAAVATTTLVGSVWADSSVGVSAAGPNSPTATAGAKFELKVPRVIALRVGDASLRNTITYSLSASALTAWGVDGSAPTAANAFSSSTLSASNDANANNTTAGNTLKLWAWTNIQGTATGTVHCAYTPGTNAITGTHIASADIGSGIGHPGATLQACSTSTTVTFPGGGTAPVSTATYEYTITAANAATYSAGSYTGEVVYTATAL